MRTAAPYRIFSIDLLRGIIMIVMALDHVRDFFFQGSFLYDPLDLTKTSGVLFLTRWITHFCAPIFVLLAGTSAYLIGQKISKRELTEFLVKRGLWLIFLELFVLSVGWTFNLNYPIIFFITLWALGASMVVLAALIYLPPKFLLMLCLIVIAGHNLLDPIHFPGQTLESFGWALLHHFDFFTWHHEQILVGYSLIPLFAVMGLGYCLGAMFSKGYAVEMRQRNLLTIGSVAILMFIVLRFINLYGDPVPWTTQKNGVFTVLSFLKVNKYPPSLLYLLITLGTACIFLSVSENWKGRVVKVLSVYGRVPFFFYITHIYVIHLIALLASALIPGQNWKVWILQRNLWANPELRGYGFSLPVTYLVWIGVVVALYPLCKWYDAYKQGHKEKWWLSYL